MSLKILAVGLGLLVLVSAAYLGSVNQKNNKANRKAEPMSFDFGDAPDGNFPSLLSSNGARAAKTDEVWLGQSVTVEDDSHQVNADQGDDGLKLNLAACEKSQAYFLVHLKNPAEASGTAYLNLYADWNKDGLWAGRGECGAEWAVQNLAVDLAQPNQEVAVVVAQFTAGKDVEKIWHRGVASLNQKLTEAATGQIESGEVEDYGPQENPEEKYYNFYCLPDPLQIKHGEKGEVKILPDLFSEPIFDVALSDQFAPVNFKRRVTTQKNSFTYESSSKDVDPPKRRDVHFVDLKVRFGKEGKEKAAENSCVVIVEHDEKTIDTPTPRRHPWPPPEIPPSVKTESGGSKTSEEHPSSPTPSTPQIQEGSPLMGY